MKLNILSTNFSSNLISYVFDIIRYGFWLVIWRFSFWKIYRIYAKSNTIRKIMLIIVSRIDILPLLPSIHCESIFLVIDVLKSMYFWNFHCVLHVLHLFHNGVHTCIFWYKCTAFISYPFFLFRLFYWCLIDISERCIVRYWKDKKYKDINRNIKMYK